MDELTEAAMAGATVLGARAASAAAREGTDV